MAKCVLIVSASHPAGAEIKTEVLWCGAGAGLCGRAFVWHLRVPGLDFSTRCGAGEMGVRLCPGEWQRDSVEQRWVACRGQEWASQPQVGTPR